MGVGRSATIGRSFGHSVRRAMSMRHSTSRISQEANLRSRPISIRSNVSGTSLSSVSSVGGTPPTDEVFRPVTTRPYSPGSTSNRLSGTFVDLRSRSPSRLSVASDYEETHSKRSSIVSTSSASTVTSLNPSPTPQNETPNSRLESPSRTDSPSPQNKHMERRTSQLIMEVHRANGGTSPMPPNNEEVQDVTVSKEILSDNSSDNSSGSGSPPELERQKTIPLFDTPL